jgi:APA family basic amino acid/polyamine antiporter
MLLCTVIYMVVAACALGASPYDVFSKSVEPLAFVLRELKQPVAASLIAGAAVIAMPTVIMVFMFGQSRVFFAMARDGLLPRSLATVSARGVPKAVTILIAAVIAGAMPLSEIASLANAGTLAAFIATTAAVMVLRRMSPELPRPFRTPLVWIVGPAGIMGCLYLFTSLSAKTIIFFAVWNVIGVLVYLAYGRTRSTLATA